MRFTWAVPPLTCESNNGLSFKAKKIIFGKDTWCSNKPAWQALSIQSQDWVDSMLRRSLYVCWEARSDAAKRLGKLTEKAINSAGPRISDAPPTWFKWGLPGIMWNRHEMREMKACTISPRFFLFPLAHKAEMFTFILIIPAKLPWKSI